MPNRDPLVDRLDALEQRLARLTDLLNDLDEVCDRLGDDLGEVCQRLGIDLDSIRAVAEAGRDLIAETEAALAG